MYSYVIVQTTIEIDLKKQAVGASDADGRAYSRTEPARHAATRAPAPGRGRSIHAHNRS